MGLKSWLGRKVLNAAADELGKGAGMSPKMKVILEALFLSALLAGLQAFVDSLNDGFQKADLSVIIPAALGGIILYLRGLRTNDPFRPQNGRVEDKE